MRPIMTAAELDSHKVDAHGRDYSRSDDGYSDMEVATGEGWRAIAGWGRDGYDLGDWPYVVISVRNLPAKVEVFGLVRPGDVYEKSAADLPAFLAELCRLDRDFFEVVQPPAFEMRQTVEGDTTVYRFGSTVDRDAAIDYLFIWYGIGRDYDEWPVLGIPGWCDETKSYPARTGLDEGYLRVPEDLRGPFSWARCDA